MRERRRHRLLVFRGSIARPTHAPSYASACGSPRRSQGLGFPGADSSRGRTSLMRFPLLISVTYFLLPILIGATALDPVGAKAIDAAHAGRLATLLAGLAMEESGRLAQR